MRLSIHIHVPSPHLLTVSKIHDFDHCREQTTREMAEGEKALGAGEARWKKKRVWQGRPWSLEE
jgi:hypothetical protein